MEAGTLRWQRVVLIIAAAGVSTVFWRAGLDPMQLPKATLAAVAAVALVVLGGLRLALVGRIVVPRASFVYALGAFLVGLLITTGASVDPSLSLVGSYQRYTGTIMYVVYVILALGVLRAFDRGSVRWLAVAFLAGVAITALYGAVQWAGLDPFAWGGDHRRNIFATLGNPNFLAAYLGIGLPLAGWVALDRRMHRSLRIGAVVVVMLAGWVMAATGPFQGPVAGAAGLGVLAVAWTLGRPRRQRTVGLLVLCIGGLLALGLLVAGLFDLGPLDVIAQQTGFRLRTYYWSAAVDMAQAAPVLGVGMGLYGSFYRAHRPAEAAAELEARLTTDSAHSVPLTMFAEGGLVLGVTYVVVVAVVAWSAWRGLRRLEGGERLLLGGLAGAWFAYQVQSLVSIDVPALAATHWLLAGGVVVLAAPPRWSTVDLPWRGSFDRSGQDGVRRRGYGPAGLVALVLLAAVAWPVTRGLRGDAAMTRAIRAVNAGEARAADDASLLATELAPWWPEMWLRRADVLAEIDDPQRAREALHGALSADPRNWQALRAIARLAAQQGDSTLARERYEQALSVEPRSPDFKEEVASFALQAGEVDWAIELLRDAVDVDPDRAESWALLGRAYRTDGRTSEARDALQHAIELDPDHEEAAELLAALSG